MSLRSRLLAGTAAALIGCLLVVGVITSILVSRLLHAQVDDGLRRASATVEVVAESDETNWTAIPALAPGLFVAIVESSGEVVHVTQSGDHDRDHQTLDLDQVRLDPGLSTVSSERGDDRVRVAVEPLRVGRFLLVGQSLHEVDETATEVLMALLAASGVAVVGGLTAAWWLLGVGLRPLRAVEASALAITDQGLGETRVPGAGAQTEVGRLARSLNAMLDRLEDARTEREASMAALQASEARMRRFVADASHELRTPIAATAAYAELFDHGARDRPDDLVRSMTGIRTETGRMTDLVDDLLLLARLDEQRSLRSDRVDVTEIVIAAVETARAMQPDRELRLDVAGIIEVVGDASRLRQVVDNLLANVRTHTPADAPCEVRLAVDDGEVVLVVADRGPGVPDEHRQHLGERFYRVDQARTRVSGGSGLGLAISRAIVEAHGGTLTIDRNHPTGLVVTVRQPELRPLQHRNQPTHNQRKRKRT